MRFAKPRLIRIGDIAGTLNPISDHNRKELAITYEMIENRKRMANGTLRKQQIITKHKWSTSWDMLPGDAPHTVDKYWGANEMEDFFDTHMGAFTLELTFGSSPVEVYTVMFSDFNKTLQKRGAYDFYSVSLSLEEV